MWKLFDIDEQKDFQKPSFRNRLNILLYNLTLAIRSRLYGNYAFPQNFHIRELDEIAVFYGVETRINSVYSGSESFYYFL